MKKNCEHIAIKIADIVFAVTSDRPIDSIRFEEAYRDFLCKEEPEVSIHASYDCIPTLSLRDEDKVFDSEVIWSLYRKTSGENIFKIHPPTAGPFPYRIAIFDSSFRKGKIFTRIPDLKRSHSGLMPSPLEYPLSEILMVCLLAQGFGVMLHACGIDDGGKGYLFAGNSTHGKTTMARLWKDQGLILNDDRIVLRYREGQFWMYGTPWHGDYNGISPHGIPLDKIFFLNHAETNDTRRKKGVVASSMLLTRSFPPLWDVDGMNYTLGFYAQLVTDLPCYELDFVPNQAIVDFVRCVR